MNRFIRSVMPGCVVLTAAMVLWAGPASAQTCPSTETRLSQIMGLSPSSDVLILGHRGYWGPHNPHAHLTPENSEAAIAQADRVCMDGIELDIKMSKDGVAFLMHDFNVGRTTNYAAKFHQARLYNPYQDGVSTYYNPPVASLNATQLDRLNLLTPDRTLTTNQWLPRLSGAMNFWRNNNLSVPMVFDVKSSDAVRMTNDIVSSYIPYAVRKMGMKVNATLYQTPSAYYKDARGISPIPIFATNMLSKIDVDAAFNSWFSFNAIEVDMKQSYGLLYTYKDRVANAGKRLSVFQAIPDENKSNGNFFKNTGECCYKLSDIYFTWKPGYADTADHRGDLNFLYRERFNLITTDEPNAAALFFSSKGKRSEHRKYF